jgi:hypothetical protein
MIRAQHVVVPRAQVVVRLARSAAATLQRMIELLRAVIRA